MLGFVARAPLTGPELMQALFGVTEAEISLLPRTKASQATSEDAWGRPRLRGSQRKWEITGICALDGTQPSLAALALLARGMPSGEVHRFTHQRASSVCLFAASLKKPPGRCGALLCDEKGIHTVSHPILAEVWRERRERSKTTLVSLQSDPWVETK